MQHRRLIHALAFVAILIGTAACADLTSPADDPERTNVPCSQPAPDPSMVCRGDVWGW